MWPAGQKHCDNNKLPTALENGTEKIQSDNARNKVQARRFKSRNHDRHSGAELVGANEQVRWS